MFVYMLLSARNLWKGLFLVGLINLDCVHFNFVLDDIPLLIGSFPLFSFGFAPEFFSLLQFFHGVLQLHLLKTGIDWLILITIVNFEILDVSPCWCSNVTTMLFLVTKLHFLLLRNGHVAYKANFEAFFQVLIKLILLLDLDYKPWLVITWCWKVAFFHLEVMLLILGVIIAYYDIGLAQFKIFL